jgi:hypothetical protein
MLYRWVKPTGLLGVLLGCLAGAGCGQSVDFTPPSPTQRNLTNIGSAYTSATIRLNRPPANLEDLSPDLEKHGPTADLLRSPNDGELFELVWGVELRGLKAKGNEIPVIAYEKKGRDGKRHVLRGRSEVLLLTESQLKSARFPPGYTLPF